MEVVRSRIDAITEAIGKQQIARFAAWFSLIIGVTNVCIAPVLGAMGALSFFTGAALSQGLDAEFRAADAELGAEFDAATSSLIGLGALAGVLMVLAIVTGVCFVIIGVGLFRRMRWARTAFVIVGNVQLFVSALLLLTGGDGFQVLWLVLLGFFVYVLATDDDIRRFFNGKQVPAR